MEALAALGVEFSWKRPTADGDFQLRPVFATL
jgi:hypothetical protein